MLDAKIIKQQLNRLQALSYAPRDNEDGLDDLVSVMETAVSEIILVAVINEWVNYHTECPKPSQLREAIFEENQKRKREQDNKTATCPQCHGAGVIVVRGRNAFDGQVVEGVRPCACTEAQ